MKELFPLFRQYLKRLPWLKDIIRELASQKEFNVNDSTELRQINESCRNEALERLKQKGLPYKILHYPNWQYKDNDEILNGAYLEICNIINAKKMIIPIPMFEHFIKKGELTYIETAKDLGGSKHGTREMKLDIRHLITVLEKSPIPKDVVVELKETLSILKQSV